MSKSSPKYSLENQDPDGRIFDPSQLTEQDKDDIASVMTALSELRDVERELSEKSREFMKLNETDMNALHFLIMNHNNARKTTIKHLSEYLGITSASTTKMLDRLEQANHIARKSNPKDRRSTYIEITPDSHEAARAAMGRHQASRIVSLLKLSPEERKIVANFLLDMANQMRKSIQSNTEEAKADDEV